MWRSAWEALKSRFCSASSAAVAVAAASSSLDSTRTADLIYCTARTKRPTGSGGVNEARKREATRAGAGPGCPPPWNPPAGPRWDLPKGYLVRSASLALWPL